MFQEFSSNNSEEDVDNTMLLLLLSQMIPVSLQQEWMEQMEQADKKGCSESFIDSLPRVPVSKIKKEDNCPICCCTYGEDNHPLIAELPHCGHRFDVECISVWLSKSTSCPLCRDDVMSHKIGIDTSQVELEEDWGMFG